MLYYLFDFLEREYNFFGAGLFRYITFRASVTLIASILIGLIIGKRILLYLKKRQIGESIRTDGPESHFSKKGTPTMGGIIIIAAILVPCLLFAKLTNVYVILMLVSTLWMGIIGFVDDYIKVFKRDKEGLKGRFKIIGQIGLGFLIALVLYRNEVTSQNALITNLPFFKYPFDYNTLFASKALTTVIYFLAIIFIVTAVTNGVNLTDGIDGLAAGTTAIVATGLAILAYVVGNKVQADYLNVIYVPNSGEVVIFLAALIGACTGFLWYNSYPAQVFMGDTGSMALGGAVVAVAIIIKMELLIPILCAVYFLESLSVVLQVSYFKYQKHKRGSEYAKANRLFKMSPLHHHFEKSGIPEPKVVLRFWIVTILFVLLAIASLKMR